MKIKRHKHIRKVLTFYNSNFGFKPPYNVLIDGTFCKAALKFKVNISEQLPRYLEAETKMWTTQCVLDECEAFGMYSVKGERNLTKDELHRWCNG